MHVLLLLTCLKKINFVRIYFWRVIKMIKIYYAIYTLNASPALKVETIKKEGSETLFENVRSVHSLLTYL